MSILVSHFLMSIVLPASHDHVCYLLVLVHFLKKKNLLVIHAKHTQKKKKTESCMWWLLTGSQPASHAAKSKPR